MANRTCAAVALRLPTAPSPRWARSICPPRSDRRAEANRNIRRNYSENARLLSFVSPAVLEATQRVKEVLFGLPGLSSFPLSCPLTFCPFSFPFPSVCRTLCSLFSSLSFRCVVLSFSNPLSKFSSFLADRNPVDISA